MLVKNHTLAHNNLDMVYRKDILMSEYIMGTDIIIYNSIWKSEGSDWGILVIFTDMLKKDVHNKNNDISDVFAVEKLNIARHSFCPI